jgi:tetratricopeptide (TPR) repeat protein
MQRDERGLALSTDSAEAVEAFDRSVEHFLKFHADTMTQAGRAIAADPGFAMAHCFKAYMLLIAANPANRPQIDATLAAAHAGAATATPREKLHLAAADAWHRGSLDESFRIWGQILDDAPTDLLAFRISDTIWFRHGQTQPILQQADRIAPRWPAELPGYDCCQTIWAFAHEEVGDTRGAERAIDAALERDRNNYFAHHVKAHIMDTDCRAREGSDWLGSQVSNWSLGNNLIHHLWWHRALLRLDLGEIDAVMRSYDEDVRNFDDPMTRATPDHYVDLQNAAALLWRLEQLGLDVGDRWQELADKAEARTGEVGHLLMVPHLMLALVATGRDAAAARFVAALREHAADPGLWTVPAIADVVIPVCEAAQAHRRGDYARVVDLLAPRQDKIRLLGGSNAQRDMFFQMLVDAAVKADRRDVVSAMIAHETATRAAPPAQRAGYAAAARWLHS